MNTGNVKNLTDGPCTGAKTVEWSYIAWGARRRNPYCPRGWIISYLIDQWFYSAFESMFLCVLGFSSAVEAEL